MIFVSRHALPDLGSDAGGPGILRTMLLPEKSSARVAVVICGEDGSQSAFRQSAMIPISPIISNLGWIHCGSNE